MQATTSAATRDARNVAPMLRATSETIHGAIVASTAVTMCASMGVGAVPPPSDRANVPMSPG